MFVVEFCLAVVVCTVQEITCAVIIGVEGEVTDVSVGRVTVTERGTSSAVHCFEWAVGCLRSGHAVAVARYIIIPENVEGGLLVVQDFRAEENLINPVLLR